MKKITAILLTFASSTTTQPLTAETILPVFDNALELMKEGTNVSSGVLNKAQDTFRNLTVWLKEADENIEKLVEEMEEVKLDAKKIQNNFIDKYLKSKTELRRVRQNLRKLAYKTVTASEDIKLLLDAMEGNPDPVLQQAQVATMKDLLKETKISLTDANEKYNTAVDILSSLSFDMKQLIEKLDRSITNGTEEYENWTSKVRWGAYGGAGSLAAGLLVADILGCLGEETDELFNTILINQQFTFFLSGICSAIGTPASIATAAIAVESAIDEYSGKLQLFQTRVETIQEKVGGMDELVKSAVEALKDEIDILDRWDSSAETVSFNFDSYSEEKLKKFEALRKIVRRGIDALQANAQEFLEQPVNILGEEQLLARYASFDEEHITWYFGLND